MLSDTLNTNEIKDTAGTEVEFSRQSSVGRKTIFSTTVVNPALPHLMTVAHLESGSGLKKRRRSVLRFDKTSISTVDSLTPVTASAYCVLDFPVGANINDDEAQSVLANLMSILATTGAGTTVLFDSTGNGAAALLNGTL